HVGPALRVAPEQPRDVEGAHRRSGLLARQGLAQELAAPDGGGPDLDLTGVTGRDQLLAMDGGSKLRAVDQDADLAEYLRDLVIREGGQPIQVREGAEPLPPEDAVQVADQYLRPLVELDGP